MVCVLVDVDGTLLGGPSTEFRFVLHLLARRRVDWRQAAQATAFSLRTVSTKSCSQNRLTTMSPCWTSRTRLDG